MHPVIKRLPPREHLQVEQGLLTTFGRVMPVGMTAAPVLTLLHATGAADPTAAWLAWVAVTALSLALVTTIAVNVGINVRTGTWDIDNPPANWQGHAGPLGGLPGSAILAVADRLRGPVFAGRECRVTSDPPGRRARARLPSKA